MTQMISFNCILCKDKFKSEVDLKSHCLFSHGKYMESCSTNLQQKRDNLAEIFTEIINRNKTKAYSILRHGTAEKRYFLETRYAIYWLLKNEYTLPKLTKKQRAKFPDYEDDTIIYETENMERYFNLVEKKESHSIRNYAIDIDKDVLYNKELMFIVKSVNGLNPDYLINVGNRYWVIKQIVVDICNCSRYDCTICELRLQKF